METTTRCMVHQKYGENIVIILQNLKCVPNLLVNLVSISKALKNGFNLDNEDVVIKLMKEDTTLYFDRLLKIKNRLVSDIKLISMPMLGKRSNYCC